MAKSAEQWGELADLFGSGAYEPSLDPPTPAAPDRPMTREEAVALLGPRAARYFPDGSVAPPADDTYWPDIYEPHGPPEPPDLIPVWVLIDQSTNVHSLIYWNYGGPDGAAMGVRFRNGREYHYWGVPLRTFLAILYRERNTIHEPIHASHGATHWQMVRRMSYPYRWVNMPAPGDVVPVGVPADWGAAL